MIIKPVLIINVRKVGLVLCITFPCRRRWTAYQTPIALSGLFHHEFQISCSSVSFMLHIEDINENKSIKALPQRQNDKLNENVLEEWNVKYKVAVHRKLSLRSPTIPSTLSESWLKSLDFHKEPKILSSRKWQYIYNKVWW